MNTEVWYCTESQLLNPYATGKSQMSKCAIVKRCSLFFYSFLNNTCAFCSDMPIYFPVWFIWKYYGNMLIISPARPQSILNNLGGRK